jgi:spermidine synthase
MTARVAKVAPLLFGSGACALIYQVAWLREMRLIFGASTAASAAVLAIFMGGLGLGGALLGRRADEHPRPLAFYARLELAIALSAALTPLLVWVARHAYIAAGGSVMLGLGAATVARLVLATLVLCVPTVLMGGTLPAASKAVESDDDVSRRHVAVLYGANTIGAVTGAFVSTFFMLEVYGTRTTLWLACLLNGLVGVTARSMARGFGDAQRRAVAPGTAAGPAAPPPGNGMPAAWFVLAAALAVGFAFLLMELVWYRMLGPLLGGSSFTFGLILAVALSGIGVGGIAYALLGSNRPATLRGFALTCTLEAACIALPYALGDRLAFLTIFLRPLGALGFPSLALGWTLVTMIVVWPAAFVAGVQFPLLVALLGRGGERVGRHVGLAYAWNTVGAIVGSLAGGFGLLPLLTATGTWSAVVVLLVVLGGIAMALSVRSEPQSLRLVMPAAVAVAALLLLTATGPTAAWRHSPIGAGRVRFEEATRNALRDWANARRRSVTQAWDGVESSVALQADNGYAFVVNGKSDGNARFDASTQVMGGLVGAILHPRPTSALVIGLGTGSTAGWLAAIPNMERVDVVELEPAIVEVARACTPVNHAVLANPKVHLFIGDAREVLLTTLRRYDIIFSEPSNPYRAGISSLFTQEFYRAVLHRLTDGGIFLQWLQAYEVDTQTIRTAYATLASVFPEVVTWHTHPIDLLLVASAQPLIYDVPALRARVSEEPFKTALASVWRATTLEGFLARFVARSSLARAIARSEGDYFNTDDRTPVEFAFARSVGRHKLFDNEELRRTARARHEDRPEVSGGDIDWEQVEDERLVMFSAESVAPAVQPHFSAQRTQRATAHARYVAGDLDGALAAWQAQPRPPRGPLELALVAEGLANRGDVEALRYIEQLQPFQPVEANAIRALLNWRLRHTDSAVLAWVAAFRRYQDDPWPLAALMGRALVVATEAAGADKNAGRRLYEGLQTPFAVAMLNDDRLRQALAIAGKVDFQALCATALQPLEPNVPWNRDFLLSRARCYRETQHPLLAQAEQDFTTFGRDEPVPFGHNLDQPD